MDRMRHPHVRGSLAGIAGTALMTIVILGGRAAGLLRNPPPRQITARVEERAGVRERLPRTAFTVSWLLAHVGYGAVSGAMYSSLRPIILAPSSVAGVIYGLVVWSVSYLGLMPSLGLYPAPAQDTRSRTAIMIVAHVVYGVTTAVVERWLSALPGDRVDDRRGIG